MPPSDLSPRYRFASPEGYQLIKTTLRPQLPYVPHDYQLEGVAQLLDGKDLVAVLATGSGKTGYYLMYMLMLLALSRNPSLCQPRYPPVPRDPCMVIVYPTNGLEEEQAAVFTKAGLSTLVINATTLEEGRKGGTDLWLVARKDIALILLSPELLTSPRFDTLLQNPLFQSRVRALGIDEIHLLYSWGQSFRQSFRQLGFARVRFPLGTRLLGTTATLLVGHPQKTILSFIGLREEQFYLLRRSNVRHNVETIFRTLSRGLGGWSFPDLKWILRDGRKTVIHCRTIAISFRVAVYLWYLCPLSSDPAKRIRMYNALCWPSYNAESRRLMQADPNSQILIATASFMVGIDLPNIADVVILGNLLSADEHVQWEGRPGRDPSQVEGARCITYVSKKAWKTARDLLDGNAPKKTSGKKTTPVQMELSMARLLLAKCITAEQNILYGNPLTDPPCSCPRCSSSLSPPISEDHGCGHCSGCRPEEVVPLPSRRQTAPNPVPRRQRLSRQMRSEGTRQLQDFRTSIYRTSTASSAAAHALSPAIFLPDATIKTILDRFALLDTPAALHEVILRDLYVLPHEDALWTKLMELREKFAEMREKHAKKLREAAAAKKAEGGGLQAVVPALEGSSRGEYGAAQSRSLDECCGSFQVDVTRNALAEMLDSANRILEPVAVEWDLVNGEVSVTDTGVPCQGGRKRSSTNSTIDPRAQTKRCLRLEVEKENVRPRAES